MNGKKMGLYHYIGWPSSHDEWREISNCIKILRYPPVQGAIAERLEAFHYHFVYLVKKSLTVSYLEDPLVKLELTVDSEVYHAFTGCLQLPPRKKHKIANNNLLNTIMGKAWWWRLDSIKLDFAYIVQNTLEFKINEKIGVVDFVQTKNGLEEQRRMGPSTLKVVFVKGIGSKETFLKGDWKHPAPSEYYFYISMWCV